MSQPTSDGIIPLEAICDAIGIPEEAMRDMYEELVHDEYKVQGADEGEVAMDRHEPELVAIHEENYEAVQEKLEASFIAGEGQPLLYDNNGAKDVLQDGNHTSFVLVDTSAPEVDSGNNKNMDDPDFQPLSRINSFIPESFAEPLERGLSILPGGTVTLPTDVVQVKLEIDQPSDDASVEVNLVVKRAVPLIGYALLVAATLSLSTTGTAVRLQEGVSGPLKSFWRISATALAFFPFALRAVKRDGGLPKLQKDEWLMFIYCGLGYMMADAFFVIALNMTSVSNVYIFANSHCLLLVLLKVITGASIVCMEGSGAVIGFIGGVICALGGTRQEKIDPQLDDGISAAVGADTERALLSSSMLPYLGDLVAMLVACGTVIYLKAAKALRPKVDLFFYMFMQFFIATLWMVIYLLLTGEDMTFSLDPHVGMFGWMLPRTDRLLVELWLVFIINFVGLVSCIAAMKYFEPLVVSCCLNLTPVLASFIAVIMKVDALPTAISFLGDIVVFGGTYMVIKSEAETEEVTDLKEAVKDKGYSTRSEVSQKDIMV